MCSADSTIEPAGSCVTGFLGWGFQRKCSDYQELKDWAGLWSLRWLWIHCNTAGSTLILAYIGESILENKCLSSFMSPAFKFISEFEQFFPKGIF